MSDWSANAPFIRCDCDFYHRPDPEVDRCDCGHEYDEHEEGGNACTETTSQQEV